MLGRWEDAVVVDAADDAADDAYKVYLFSSCAFSGSSCQCWLAWRSLRYCVLIVFKQIETTQL